MAINKRNSEELAHMTSCVAVPQCCQLCRIRHNVSNLGIAATLQEAHKAAHRNILALLECCHLQLVALYQSAPFQAYDIHETTARSSNTCKSQLNCMVGFNCMAEADA
jgi:hypothetical protein